MPTSSGQPERHLTPPALFFGPEGLRAGWGIALAAALYLFFVTAFSALAELVGRGNQPSLLLAPSAALLGESAGLLSVVLLTWIMSRIERRPMRVYGIGLLTEPDRRRWLPHLAAGLAWGLVLLSILIAAMHGAGLLVLDAPRLSIPLALRYAAVWFLDFLVVGLFEEYLFRGYLQFTLARGLTGLYARARAPHSETLGFWTAAALVSFGFGFTHRTNSGESPIGLAAAGLIALVFCLSLRRTGSLWWAIGFHAAWDWAQSYLYGAADSGILVQGHLFTSHPAGGPVLSGGLTGPEGSALVLSIVALAAAVVLLTLPEQVPRGVQPVTPPPPLH